MLFAGGTEHSSCLDGWTEGRRKLLFAMTDNMTYDKLIFELDTFGDERGVLAKLNVSDDTNMPFDVKRVFWISGVPVGKMRGKHAHRTCQEVLFALHGSFNVRVTDGIHGWQAFHLNEPHRGLTIPAMYWCELSDFTADAVCLCLASEEYDAGGYISDYQSFLRETGK